MWEYRYLNRNRNRKRLVELGEPVEAIPEVLRVWNPWGWKMKDAVRDDEEEWGGEEGVHVTEDGVRVCDKEWERVTRHPGRVGERRWNDAD